MIPFDFDPRLHAIRSDLADQRLATKVKAARYAEGVPFQCRAASVPMFGRPDAAAPMTSELLLGETFDVFEAVEGWLWGQCRHDRYVGYAPAAGLAADIQRPTHRVRALSALVYPGSTLKSAPLDSLSMGALVTVAAWEGRWAHLTTGGFIDRGALNGVDAPPTGIDPVSEAERWVEVPYLWGGRSARGLDCSGLVQRCLAEIGISALRDSDMQEASVGDLVPEHQWSTNLRRGDIVFFPGHVGFMVNELDLIHANATAMAVSIDPLRRVVDQVRADGGVGITSVRRLQA